MHPGLRVALAACFAIVVLLGALPAGACPNCLSGSEGTREAYYGTTVFMMLVPFAGLGLLIWWIRRATTAVPKSRP